MAFLPTTPALAAVAVRRRGHRPRPPPTAGQRPADAAARRGAALPPSARLPGGGGSGGGGVGGGGGGVGGSPLPRVAAAVAVGVLALGVAAYAGRAPLTAAALSRAVGADVRVGDVEVDWWPRRDADGVMEAPATAATVTAAGPPAAAGAASRRWPPPPTPPAARPALGGPVVGLRDVVLSDGEGRVTARVPSVRVRLGRDAAADGRGGRVADVELLRPHAYLVLDAQTRGAGNWGKLAAAAEAARVAAGAPRADGDGRSRAGGAAGDGGSPPPPVRRVAAGAVPTFAGVRLRSLAFPDGADLSVATSVPRSTRSLSGTAAEAAGTDLSGAGRPLLCAPVHVPAVTLDVPDGASVAAIEVRLAEAAFGALARAGVDEVAAAATAAGLPPPAELAAAVRASLRSAAGVRGEEAVAAARESIRHWRGWRGGVDAQDHPRSEAATR